MRGFEGLRVSGILGVWGFRDLRRCSSLGVGFRGLWAQN